MHILDTITINLEKVILCVTFNNETLIYLVAYVRVFNDLWRVSMLDFSAAVDSSLTSLENKV